MTMCLQPAAPRPVEADRSLPTTPAGPGLEPAVRRLLRRGVADVTSARVFLGHVNGSYRTESLLALVADQAVARRAVTTPLDLSVPSMADLVGSFGVYEVASAAPSMAIHLADPALGRRLSERGRREVRRRATVRPKVQFVIGDGLSATAVHVQVPRLLPALLERCAEAGWSTGPPVAVRHCRVGVLGDVGETTGADVVVLLIGERPGLGSTESLSVYAQWRPTTLTSDADRNVISNIHDRGLSSSEAVDRTMALLGEILDARVSGVALHSVVPPLVLPPPTAAEAVPTATPTRGGAPC